MTKNEHDPRGLIAEAFNVDGISPEDCRTIFLDWAVSFPGVDMKASAAALHQRFATQYSGHPMLDILVQATLPPPTHRRRRK